MGRRGRGQKRKWAVAIVAIALGASLLVPAARADFPYVGDGSAGSPSSWALAPGEVPSNLGGLGWKFAATPKIPPSKESNLSEWQGVTQDNSQQDELCGVTGMSLVDSHATFPAETGSCIAAGTPVKTAFEVSLGRPDVSIGELIGDPYRLTAGFHGLGDPLGPAIACPRSWT